ncbi:MAG: alpha/beta fold hydrolase [Bryobacterales bacterium]|nr:alpha/beta fold hydrolase [Bryobacterales bacterium]
MHYVDVGPKDAQPSPVVLVHGTPVSSLVYRRFIGRLATDRRVIAVDHLGFGRSDKRPDADYRPSALAGHLERFLDEMNLDRPVLVVHDFGGPIGLSYAVEHPDRVRGTRLVQYLDVVACEFTGSHLEPDLRQPTGTLPVPAAQLLDTGAVAHAVCRQVQADAGTQARLR